MSEIVEDVLGLISSKLRDYAAEQLSDGDLNDEQCRKIVVRELDDIASKLYGLSRKYLLASLLFFKEGVTRLYSSRATSSRSYDVGPSSSKVFADQITAQEARVAGATAMTQCYIVQTASKPSNAIGKSRIRPQGRYELPSESFKEAKRLATKAFSKVALSTEDRVMASKLRIACRILESLADPEAAVTDCLRYLKDLQDLSSIQAVFSVWKEKTGGAFFQARSAEPFFEPDRSRSSFIVESIQLMNTLLLDMTLWFTRISMAFFQWPTIKIGNGMFHPLAENDKAWGRHERNDLNVPWKRTFSCSSFPLAYVLTSKGKLISAEGPGGRELEISEGSFERRSFYAVSIPGGEVTEFLTGDGLTIDKNDNVYAVVRVRRRTNPCDSKTKLVTLDANGKEKSCRFLHQFANLNEFLAMSINKDGLVVICRPSVKTIFVYDPKGRKRDYMFALPHELDELDITDRVSLTVSRKNAIFFAFVKKLEGKFFIYIFTMAGKLKRSLEVTYEGLCCEMAGSVYNHVNGTVLVGVIAIPNDSDDAGTIIYSFSVAGDLLGQIEIPGYKGRLLSHPKGPIVLLHYNNSDAIILQ